jgi:hypothetical protein
MLLSTLVYATIFLKHLLNVSVETAHKMGLQKRGGLLTSNSSWQAKQSFAHTTVAFYSTCMKMCDDFYPNVGDKRTGCHENAMACTSLFIRVFLINNMAVTAVNTLNLTTCVLFPNHLTILCFPH